MSTGDRSLKPGWSRVALGDVARLNTDRASDPEAAGFSRYVGLEHIDPGDLTIRRWGNVSEGTTFTNVFTPGQVLFGKRRAYQRKVAAPDFSGVCSSDIYVLESKDDHHLLPELLPFVCQTDVFFKHAVGTSVGSLSPRTNWKSLATYEFVLPPLDEQHRQVKVMASIDASRDSILNAEAKAVEVERAFLSEAFGSFGTCPPGATLVPLSDVAEIRTGLAKGQRPDVDTTRRPYLSVANVEDGKLNLRKVKEIVVKRRYVDRYSLRHGDVLMTEGGDLDKLGRGAVWQGEVAGCLHQNHVFAVRTDLDNLDPRYLAAVARSQYGRSFFLLNAKRTSNLASVNKKQVSSFPIPMRPLSAQRSWLRCYQFVREAEVLLSAKRDKICSLREKALCLMDSRDTASRSRAVRINS